MTNFKGHICANAETRFIEALKDTVTEFTVAENYTDRNGKQYTQYHKISGFGKRYANMESWLLKGRFVEITGREKPDGYISKETGKVVTYLKINNPSIEFLDKKPSDEPAPVIPEAEVTAEDADDEPF